MTDLVKFLRFIDRQPEQEARSLDDLPLLLPSGLSSDEQGRHAELFAAGPVTRMPDLSDVSPQQVGDLICALNRLAQAIERMKL